uniref:Uncharacterized protein n=1 Tax=Romanomermis culicivorax TaxID=13658 RepID=A0A915KK41_ROMCU
MAISLWLNELAWSIGSIPEKRMLKATVLAKWALHASWLALKSPAVLHFFNNPHALYLQPDVLAYAALNAFYPILLFLAFDRYRFIPKIYNAPSLYPQDLLEAAEIDRVAKMLIATFHTVSLTDVLPTNSINKVYPTISQIALPAIMRDEVLSAYQFFMYNFTLSYHGQCFCLGTQPNDFCNMKTLMPTTHSKLLTTSKAPKKKKKKQKDEWNKWPDVSDDDDPSLQPRKLLDDTKRLQAAIVWAMKSSLMHLLIELLGFPLSRIYKLTIRDRLDFENDTLLPTDVNDIWIDRLAADQPLRNRTYHSTHYCYLPNTILSLLQVDGDWFQCLTTTMPLAVVLGSPWSRAEFAYINDFLAKHAQSLDNATPTPFYTCMWYTCILKLALPIQ